MITLTKDEQHIYRIHGLCGLHAGVIARRANTVEYTGQNGIDRLKEKIIIHKATGILPERIVMLDQVHGKDIISISQPPQANEPYAARADGMFTGLHGLCLVVRTADCVPVLLYDSKRGMLAALHSGWRGCQQNITACGIQRMIDDGSDPGSLHLLLLPSIGPDAYEVGEDVAVQFEGYTLRKEHKIYLNMWKHIYDAAVKYMIPHQNVFVSNQCTYTNAEFFSHRRGDGGRNLNFAYLL